MRFTRIAILEYLSWIYLLIVLVAARYEPRHASSARQAQISVRSESPAPRSLLARWERTKKAEGTASPPSPQDLNLYVENLQGWTEKVRTGVSRSEQKMSTLVNPDTEIGRRRMAELETVASKVHRQSVAAICFMREYADRNVGPLKAMGRKAEAERLRSAAHDYCAWHEKSRKFIGRFMKLNEEYKRTGVWPGAGGKGKGSTGSLGKTGDGGGGPSKREGKRMSGADAALRGTKRGSANSKPESSSRKRISLQQGGGSKKARHG